MFGAIRLVGWAFLFVGFLLLGRDIMGAISTDHGFHPKTLAYVWDVFLGGSAEDTEGRWIFLYGKWMSLPYTLLIHGWAFAELLIVGFALEIAGRERANQAHKKASKGDKAAQVTAQRRAAR